MAAKGWLLQSMGNRFAVFRKSEPAIVRYRCDVDGTSPLDNTDSLWMNRVEWERVCYRTKTSIYCTKDLSVPEPHSDTEAFAASLKRLYSHPILAAVAVIAAIAFIIYNYSSDTSMFRRLLLGRDPTLLVLLFGIYQCPMVVWGFFHIKSIQKKLMAGQPIQHNVPYKGTRFIQGILPAAILLLYVAMMSQALFHLAWNSFYHIPSGTLPIIRMTDILPAASFTPDSKEGNNFYDQSWSIAVPQQIDLFESGVQNGVKGSDGNLYTLRSQRYWVLTPGLARLLAQNISADTIITELFTGGEGAKVVPYQGSRSGFDGLWIFNSEDGRAHEIIALTGNTVYHIGLTGAKTPVDLVTLLKNKIASEN